MVKIYESVPEHSLYLTCKLNLARVVVVHRLFMFLPSDRDADEVDERAGVINGVAKALDKRMDKQAQQQKGDRDQLKKDISDLTEKLAAIEKSLAASQEGATANGRAAGEEEGN